MTHSLSYSIEEAARAKHGESARIVPAAVREALNVLEGEITSSASKYSENMHTHIIKKLVQPSFAFTPVSGHQPAPEAEAEAAVTVAPKPAAGINWMPWLVLALSLVTVADKWL